jgi:cobalt-zinc-cadmium efflux system protein
VSRPGAGRGRDARALTIVLAMTALLAVAELVGGLVSDSLALIADAGHMLSDVGSLALALGALWLARRPPTAQMSFGFRRAEILAALFNGVALVAIAIWIFVEAAQRLSDPPEILAGVTLAIALAGLAVNVAGVVILARSGGRSLNLRAATLHVVADLLGSVGVIVAAVIILATGWLYADPVVSILIGVLVLASSWRVLRESLGVLLEATPEGIDADAVGRRMAQAPGVTEVHDLHIWAMSTTENALTVHLVFPAGHPGDAFLMRVSGELSHKFRIHHPTMQIEIADGAPCAIENH